MYQNLEEKESNMEKIFYNAILSTIQKEIKENSEEIKKLEKLDLKYCKIKIEINDFLEIIENYKNKEIKNNNKNLNIYCNGNPYIVLNLILIAILNNSNLKINIDNIMLGVNKYLIKIINDILIKNKLNIKIILFEKLENNEEKIIFIDRINDFNLSKNKNKIYIPYQSIDIFYDNEEFEELFEKIYNYALNMNIDVDLFDEEEGIQNLFNYGKGKIKIIFTKNKELIKKYIGKNIIINENPFKEKNIIFDEKTIMMIDY